MLSYNLQNILIAQSPGYAYGWQWVSTVRVFIFLEIPPSFSIDFSAQEIALNTLYIVPPTHFHFLSHSQRCKFWCIDIPVSKLNAIDAELLISFKFRHQKQIPLSNALSHTICSFLENKRNNAGDVITLLEQANSEFLEQINFAADDYFKHLPLVKKLISLLWSRDEKLEHLAIKKIALEFCCSPKTLSRACKAVFGQSVQNVLQYQLLLASLFMMHHCLDIGAISKELGFADKKSFIKFIKRKANHTPKQIIDLIHGKSFAPIV